MLIPIGHPGHGNNSLVSGRILAGDIGGTKCNLAIFDLNEEKHNLIVEETFYSKNFKSFEELIEAFYHHTDEQIDAVSLGIAGPVYKGKVKATNLPWTLDAELIAQRLDVRQVHLLNDLEANAYGIAMLQEEELKVIFSGDDSPEGNAAVIAPGTGLGEAGMYWDGRILHPFATEGGHSSFSPRDHIDLALFQYLQKKFGHVSWERVLSGPGIYNIFCFMVEEMKREIPDVLNNDIRHAPQPPLLISQAAADGNDVCHEVLERFFKYLGEEAAHLSLKIKATGGLFIGGGIVPDILNQQFEETFTKAFLDIGRMKPLLEKMPVKVIMNERTPLLGAAFYGAISSRDAQSF
ncbi:MAG: glucokinase [Fulvivirga sp.]